MMKTSNAIARTIGARINHQAKVTAKAGGATDWGGPEAGQHVKGMPGTCSTAQSERRQLRRHRGAPAVIAWKVVSLVAMPRIASTNCITGTGFMKWRPMKLSGRSVEAASRVTEMEEVLVAIMA